MAHVAQLNTRMDAQLKAAGDPTLDLYGISPSELIKALWAKIALGEEALHQVVKVLAAEPAAGSAQAAAHNQNASRTASWIKQRQAAFEREGELDPATYVPLTPEQLEDLVYEDYLEEREAHNAH